MNKVYFIVNYCYSLSNMDSFEDDYGIFEQADYIYPMISSGVFSSLEDALKEAHRVAEQEQDVFSDVKSVAEDKTSTINTVTAFFDEDTIEASFEIAISCYAIYEFEVR